MGHKFSAAADRIYLQNVGSQIVFDTNNALPHIMKEVSFTKNIIWPSEASNGLSGSNFRWTNNVNALRSATVLDALPPSGANFVLIRVIQALVVSGAALEGGSIAWNLRDGFAFQGSVLTANSSAYRRRIDAVFSGGQLQLQAWHSHTSSFVAPKLSPTPVNGANLTISIQGVAYIGRVA